MYTNKIIKMEEKYEEWVERNAEEIIEIWLNEEPEPTEDIYEGVLDDDYPDAYDAWAESVTIEDVPSEVLKEAWEMNKNV